MPAISLMFPTYATFTETSTVECRYSGTRGTIIQRDEVHNRYLVLWSNDREFWVDAYDIFDPFI